MDNTLLKYYKYVKKNMIGKGKTLISDYYHYNNNQDNYFYNKNTDINSKEFLHYITKLYDTEKTPYLYHMSIGNVYNEILYREIINHDAIFDTDFYHDLIDESIKQIIPWHVQNAIKKNIKVKIIYIAPDNDKYNTVMDDNYLISKIAKKYNSDFTEITNNTSTDSTNKLFSLFGGNVDIYICDILMPSQYIFNSTKEKNINTDIIGGIKLFYSSIKQLILKNNSHGGKTSIFSFAVFSAKTSREIIIIIPFALFPEIFDMQNYALLGEWKNKDFIDIVKNRQFIHEINLYTPQGSGPRSSYTLYYPNASNYSFNRCDTCVDVESNIHNELNFRINSNTIHFTDYYRI